MSKWSVQFEFPRSFPFGPPITIDCIPQSEFLILECNRLLASWGVVLARPLHSLTSSSPFVLTGSTISGDSFLARCKEFDA